MAPYTKTIICLANSWKPGGRCVAGLELDGDRIGGWVRPVSDREHRELTYMEMRYEDLGQPALLDVVEVGFIREIPEHHQRENHLVDATQRWKKIDQMAAESLLAARQTPDSLWLNGSHSGHGTNDRVAAQTADRELDSSLLLIEPEEPWIEVEDEFNPFTGQERRRKRVSFRYNGQSYRFSLTDPVVANRHREEGRYPLRGRPLFCVSLAEAFEGFCYKLVAGVVEIV